MFGRILIANRGEIAARVIATCRRLGVETVAVHSDADAGAAHVVMADRAVRIGPAAPADSYLRGDAIVDAALATGAEAIHPGYGFLSENAGFASAVAGAGLVFIGPPAQAIRAMGLKDAAKRAMEAAGVPVVPGYHGADQDDAVLAEAAAGIGFPVLVKARAGGGGKGMRRVDRPDDFAAALASARREAESAFGDGAVLVERCILRPRHVEIQVFADAHGNVVHLFERDCSLQRRHQKIIEEAPAPGMSAAVRDAMGGAAVAAARAIGYVGAGTVEFIADAADGLRPDGFWFMEMNTRLQVEHPVTEAVTGHDLVEWQLRVAAGDPLPVAQSDLRLDGHALEARLYAEDPAAGFLPATGRVTHLAFPGAHAFRRGPLRVDSGIRNGDAITPHYDPMIAKLIAHGPDRASALRRLRVGLASARIGGLTTNLQFLARLCADPEFDAGRVDTGLIDRELATLTAPTPPDPVLVAVAGIAALGLLVPGSASDPWQVLNGWHGWGRLSSAIGLEIAGACHDLRVTCDGPGRFVVTLFGQDRGSGGTTTDAGTSVAAARGAPAAHDLTLDAEGDGDGWRVRAGGVSRGVHVVRDGAGVTVFSRAATLVALVRDPLAMAEAAGVGDDRIAAPMPGLVRQVLARPGEPVAAGAALAVMEAMKMELTLAAPRDGVVAEVAVEAGAHVAQGALLVRLEHEDG